MDEASWIREAEGSADVTIEENWLFRLRRERYVSRASGKSHAYYVLRLLDAVQVIAITPERQLVLVRQFRAGSGRDSLEPPGGLIEPNEDPAVAGARELIQETGYAGERPKRLGAVWSNPSILTSKIHTVVIENARKVAEPALDPEEEVAVELAPVCEVSEMIAQGRFDHALAVMGLLWWLHQEGEQTPLLKAE